MVWHCANPACSLPLHRLKDGRLFRFEIRSTGAGSQGQLADRPQKVARDVSHFWLCGECSSRLTLIFDPLKGVAVVPLDSDDPGDSASVA